VARHMGFLSTRRVLALAVGVILTQVALAAGSEVNVVVDHGYFLRNDDPAAVSWETEPTVAWSRWDFFLLGSDTAFPIQVSIRTETPIDLSIWHNPEILVSTPPNYTWLIEQEGPVPTFSWALKPVVDPGVVVTREVTPELIPPGDSKVRANVTVRVVRAPSVDGVESHVSRGFIQVFGVSEPGVLTMQWCTLQIWPVGAWLSQNCGHRWCNPCAWLDIYDLMVGAEYSIDAVFDVTNETGKDLLFKPVVGVNWELPSDMQFSSGNSMMETNRYGFQIVGPGARILVVDLSARGAEKLVNWTYETRRKYPDSITAYWGMVLEQR